MQIHHKKQKKEITSNSNTLKKGYRRSRVTGRIGSYQLIYYRFPDGRVVARRRPFSPTVMSLSGAEQFDPDLNPQRR